MTPLELSSKSPRKPIAPNDIVPFGLDDPARFLNRDLQWLEFNCRVLAQGDDPHVPLLERVRFLAIFGSNLDEFFMKRVGGFVGRLMRALRALRGNRSRPKIK